MAFIARPFLGISPWAHLTVDLAGTASGPFTSVNASSNLEDDPIAALLGVLGGGGAAPGIRVVDLSQLAGLKSGEGRILIEGALKELRRPAPTGVSYNHPLLPEVPCVRSPCVRTPSDTEKTIFGDIWDVVPRDPQSLTEILAHHARYSSRGENLKAAETGRFLSRLLAREADSQMAQTNPEKAVGLLADARVFFDVWKSGEIRARRQESPRASTALEGLPILERLEEEWQLREECWTAIAQGLKTARGQMSRAESMLSAGTGAQAAHLFLSSGRRLLGIARKLRDMTYPTFVHHVLHTGGEDALEKAAQHYRSARLGREAEQASRLLDEAKRLHAESHEWMYWSDEWVAPVSEDGLTVLRPNAISIRGMSVSLALFLGLPLPDPREIFDSVRDDSRILPVQKAVDDLTDYRRAFEETAREVDEITALTDLFVISLGVENSLRDLKAEIGPLPAYLVELYNGFINLVAAAGRMRERQSAVSRDMARQLSRAVVRAGEKGRDLLRSQAGEAPVTLGEEEARERLDMAKYLMHVGKWDLAHTLVVSLERDLSGSSLLSEVKKLHDEIHERMLPASGNPLSDRLSDLVRSLFRRV